MKLFLVAMGMVVFASVGFGYEPDLGEFNQHKPCNPAVQNCEDP